MFAAVVACNGCARGYAHGARCYPHCLAACCVQTGAKPDYGWSVDFKADPVPDADNDNKVAFEAMLPKLSADAASFVVFDFADTKTDGRKVKKLVLIKWCPDSVNVRIKLVVDSTYPVRQRLAAAARSCGVLGGRTA